LSIGPPASENSKLRSGTTEGRDGGSVLAYQRVEVITMPQRSNNPADAEPRSSVPQDQDDELEMAEDDEDLDEDDDFEDDEAEEEDEVED
jgi:hypothetical protein